MAGTVNLGHLEAMLGVNTTQLTRDMNRARAIMTKGAQQMQAIGKSMTLGLSLPLAILGGLAVNTFAKFEKSMNRNGPSSSRASLRSTGDRHRPSA